MPVTNQPYGVWKVLQWTDVALNADLNQKRFVVEDATVGSQQEARVEKFIQGTALPVIMHIGGASATMKITAPLLVQESVIRSASVNADPIHDGFTMWRYIWNANNVNSMFSSTYQRETGFIMDELTFRVDAQKGARYTFGLKGDADYLGEETIVTPTVSTNGISLVDGTSVWAGSSSGYPFPKGEPLRVAAFYDITANVGNLEGWVENFQISYRFTTTGFNYVGQRTQRQVMGIGGVEVQFQGTMISTNNGLRAPRGYQFPWQAMNARNDVTDTVGSNKTPVGFETYGGIVHTNPDFVLSIMLRDNTNTSLGTIDILPGVTVEKNVIQQSSVQYTADLIRTQFQGVAWITDPSQLVTP